MEQALKWQRNKRFYAQAVEDLQYLSRFKPKGIFSADAALNVFKDRWEDNIKNMWGDPDLVYKHMCENASTVINIGAGNAAHDVALRKATDESGKLLLTRSNYEPTKRNINIYSYDPYKDILDKRKVREKTFHYKPKEWELLMEDPIAYRMEVARLIQSEGWLDDSLEESEARDGSTLWTDLSYDPVRKLLQLKAIYEPARVVEEITKVYTDRYSNCEAP